MPDPWSFASFGQSGSWIDNGGGPTFATSTDTTDHPFTAECWPAWPGCPNPTADSTANLERMLIEQTVLGWQEKPGSSSASEIAGSGSAGAGSTDTGTEQGPQSDPPSCVSNIVRAGQAFAGVLQVIGGTAQGTEGMAQAAIGVFGAVETGGVSLLAIPGGITNAVLGSAGVLDGGNLIRAAWRGSPEPASMFVQIGQRYGGESGPQAGEITNLGALVVTAAQSAEHGKGINLSGAIIAWALSNANAICSGQ